MRIDSFDPVSRQGLAITNLYGIELVISAVLFILVAGVLATALVRFRAAPDDGREPPQISGHTGLEVVWTVTPALILAVVFLLVVQTMRTVDAAQPGELRLRVIGHQWWWEFEYPDQAVVAANELHVPVGVPLRVDLDSADVIHSFWVPQFGWMRDAVPGKTNQIGVLVDRAGEYVGACTQYCGAQHAWMRLRVVAEPPAQFDAWAQQQSQAAAASSLPGERVFLQNTCVSCHAIRGVQAPAQVGPDLTHVGSRTTLGAGVIENTPENLRRWLRDAPLVKPGVLMPSFHSLSDQELTDLIEYLESLR
ncbi:MAG TPA: cytochrome c oxidase subunit II [Chloroflexota bacterium]|nr:cytochrome c oxidase subunit II [Chloroflexota bacterium]